MNAIIICACVPTFLPLLQQVTGQKDYIRKKLPDPTAYKDGPRQPLRKSVSLRPLDPYSTIASVERAKVEPSHRKTPQSDIRTTTTIESQWEAV